MQVFALRDAPVFRTNIALREYGVVALSMQASCVCFRNLLRDMHRLVSGDVGFTP